MKNSERVARCRSVERNLSSTQVRRGFSSCLYHFSNGATSTVQNCAEAPRAAAAQEDSPSRYYWICSNAAWLCWQMLLE